MSRCKILGTTVTWLLPQLPKVLLSSHPAAPSCRNGCKTKFGRQIPLWPYALGQGNLFWSTGDLTVPCALTVSPAGGPCPTEEHTHSAAWLKSQLLVSWAKGKVSALQCLQQKQAAWLRKKSKFFLACVLGCLSRAGEMKVGLELEVCRVHNL